MKENKKKEIQVTVTGKFVSFLIFIILLITLINLAFAYTPLPNEKNMAKHTLKEIYYNGFSIDADNNDRIDVVDSTNSFKLLAIKEKLLCTNGILIGINEKGPICQTLTDFYQEFNKENKSCARLSQIMKGDGIYDCQSVFLIENTEHKISKKGIPKKVKKKNANSEDYELVFGSKKNMCPDKATIVCCIAALPKNSNDTTIASSSPCQDSDYQNEENGIYTKGNVTYTIDEQTELVEDYCYTENLLKEQICENDMLVTKDFVCTCKNGSCQK